MTVNKIVRDKIPGFFAAEGKAHHLETLDRVFTIEWLDLLANKIEEEASELAEAIRNGNVPEILEEAADTLDVLDLIKTEMAISDDMVESARAEKFKRSGGFGKGYVLTYEK